MTKRHRPRPPAQGIAPPTPTPALRAAARKRGKNERPRPIEIPLPPGLMRGRDVDADCRAFSFGECWCLLGTGKAGDIHLAIGHASRPPMVPEIRAACAALVPAGVTMGMIVSPRDQRGRDHPNICELVRMRMAPPQAGRALLVGPDGQPIHLEVAGA